MMHPYVRSMHVVKYELTVSSDVTPIITPTTGGTRDTVRSHVELRILGPTFMENDFRPRRNPRYGFGTLSLFFCGVLKGIRDMDSEEHERK